MHRPGPRIATLLALAEWLVPALRLGRAFALAWDEAKQREGLIDFDDQIRMAAGLLTDGSYAQWIGYKLDRRFDHILVDEAQDTNAAQWRIIDALTQEFFVGEGQRGDRLRTLFVVGDYKQAIFRFQGTSPENFEAARKRVRDQMLGAAVNARSLRANTDRPELREWGLDRSFRTAQPVLDFVDAAIGLIGHENIGLDRPAEGHRGLAIPGNVTLWRPVGQLSEDLDAEDEAEDGEAWLSDRERKLADNIARQVKAWTDAERPGFLLTKGGARRAGPGDIMVLVRKRGALAGLLVARLHAHGVPVAGVDRLRLGAPLAVKDLAAALRFAAQPLDDLNLAALLVSPLIGWSQQDLLDHAWREKGVHLWDHLRRSAHPLVAATLEQLGTLLAKADFDLPHALLHWLLSGPWQARRKLVARLGREANDPIDELLNAAHAYAASATPSLAGFLAWFDAGEGELKREADNAQGLVRVMTVHGAKGLQAPIVILADATGNPDNSRKEALDLADPHARESRAIPLPRLRGAEEIGRIAAARETATRESAQEHWRLLYVAMTRAEEALFVGGALGLRDKGVAPAESWFARLAEAMGEREEVADPIWTGRRQWGDPVRAGPAAAGPAELPLPPVLPPWLLRPPPEEPRPPRPLAPSSLGEDAGHRSALSARRQQRSGPARRAGSQIARTAARGARRRTRGGRAALACPQCAGMVLRGLRSDAEIGARCHRGGVMAGPVLTRRIGRSSDRSNGWRPGYRRDHRSPADLGGPYPPDRLQDRAAPARGPGRSTARDPSPDGRLCRRAGSRLSGAGGRGRAALYRRAPADRDSDRSAGASQAALAGGGVKLGRFGVAFARGPPT